MSFTQFCKFVFLEGNVLNFLSVFYVILLAGALSLFFALFIVTSSISVALTSEFSHVEKYKCVDDMGGEFVDEWCEKKIYTDWASENICYVFFACLLVSIMLTVIGTYWRSNENEL